MRRFYHRAIRGASSRAVDLPYETITYAFLRDSGLGVRRNKPYAGGYIIERHGAPTQGRHAVQIEINRALYMDERRIVKLEKADRLAKALLRMAQALAARAGGFGQTGLAAE